LQPDELLSEEPIQKLLLDIDFKQGSIMLDNSRNIGSFVVDE
jgi:hypothetical protein